MSDTSYEPPSRHPLKPALFILTLFAGGILVTILSLYKIGFANSYQVLASKVEAVAPRTDLQAGPRGEDLLGRLVGCAQCHGANLAGKTLRRGEQGVYLSSPSLVAADRHFTTPKGLLTLTRALRDGRDDDGRALWLMPQERIGGLCDADIAAIAVALDARPRREAKPEVRTHLTFAAYIRAALREAIVVGPRDERWPAPSVCPSPGDDDASGAYLYRITGCAACHGQKPSWARTPSPAMATETSFALALSASPSSGKKPVHLGQTGERIGGLTPTETRQIYLSLKAHTPEAAVPL